MTIWILKCMFIKLKEIKYVVCYVQRGFGSVKLQINRCYIALLSFDNMFSWFWNPIIRSIFDTFFAFRHKILLNFRWTGFQMLQIHRVTCDVYESLQLCEALNIKILLKFYLIPFSKPSFIFWVHFITNIFLSTKTITRILQTITFLLSFLFYSYDSFLLEWGKRKITLS